MYEIKLQRKRSSLPDVTVKNADDIVDTLRKIYPEGDLWRETCRIVLLDRANRTIGHYLVSTGSADKVIIDVRGICTAAVMASARSVVLSHNHPSGNPLPGRADIEGTEALRRALSVLDIRLLDHIVLGEESYYSFCEEKETRYRRA